MRNKKVIYISITIILIVTLAIIGLGLTKSANSDGNTSLDSEAVLGLEQESNETEITEFEESLEEEETEVSEEEKEVVEEEALQETEDRAIKTYRYYGFLEEYRLANTLESEYIDVSNIKDEILQEKVNMFIQQKMLDEMLSTLISNSKAYYDNENEFNELREIPFLYDSFYTNAYLYGTILSMSQYENFFWVDGINEQGILESSSISHYYDVCNYDMSTGTKVELSDILMIGEEFYSILENVDIRLYNEAYEADIYRWFMSDLEYIIQMDGEYYIPSDYKWLIDAEGHLLIGKPGNEGPDYFKIPLFLFEDIIKPGYEEYAKNYLKGYDFFYYMEEQSSDLTSCIDVEQETVKDLNCEFVHRDYQYNDDVKLEYFQVTGIENVNLQCQINDFIMQSILTDVIGDLSYTYLNNRYYSEDCTYKEQESLIYVESIIPDHYLNGQVLSFTHTEKVTRKAYTTEEGIKREEISKGPYFQAFNYDISKGKELTFGDVFVADDELFDIIDNWFCEESGLFDWDSEWKYEEESYQNFAKSIGISFISEAGNAGKSREEFVNGESEDCHWFIDQSEEGSNLCIYMYNTIDTEKKCLKIPVSILKDKIKPEYKDAF